MKMKRMLSAALAGCLLAGMLAVAPVEAVYAPFPDIADKQVAECAEFLRLMGVVDGVPGGAYDPSGTLNRAQFCKMAVTALGRQSEESAQRGRTIYLDVGAKHWARGYINLASAITLGGGDDGKSGTCLVSGVGDGTFQPDRTITYGEAVTILCRVLGYGASDVSTGGAWYDGYLAVGGETGLTEGLYLSGGDTITRGQAAILFYNLYFSKPKGSNETYLTTVGGKEIEGGVVLDTDATADDGTPNAFKTTTGTYKTERRFDSALEGQEGKLLLDKDGLLLSFQAKEGTSQRRVSIRYAEALYFVTAEGEEIEVKPTATVYKDGEQTTWEGVWQDLPNSKNSTVVASAVMHFGADGRLAYIFFSGGGEADEETEAIVARTAPNGTNPFSSLGSVMYKNGVPATAADLRQFDVATRDATGAVQVSDWKLTGIYENVSPSPASPLKVRVLGRDFDVLPSARRDLAAFSVGGRITLLFTADGKVAGAVSADTVRAEAVGMVTAIGDKRATVELLRGNDGAGKRLSLSGEFSGSAERYLNRLVTVSSASKGYLDLQLLSGASVRGSLDTAARTLGTAAVSPNVAVYDHVSGGELVEVDYATLPATVAAGKIDYVSTDYAGRVDCVVLSDATGDAYQYGYTKYKNETRVGGSLGGVSGSYTVRLAWVEQGSDAGAAESEKAVADTPVGQNIPGGIAYASGKTGDGDRKLAAWVKLQSISGVGRDSFDMEKMTVTAGGATWHISDKVQCYNKGTQTWYTPGEAGVKAARAYSDELILWYDRGAAAGGKIRLIEVP